MNKYLVSVDGALRIDRRVGLLTFFVVVVAGKRAKPKRQLVAAALASLASALPTSGDDSETVERLASTTLAVDEHPVDWKKAIAALLKKAASSNDGSFGRAFLPPPFPFAPLYDPFGKFDKKN